MNKLARCPECGGDVRFTHQASVLAVCTFCQSVLARKGVDVDKIGKVGEVADVPSPLQLHMRGSAYGGFSVVGLLQLDHGAGTWNEWYLGLDSGKWLWLAEAQGRYYLTAPVGTLRDAPSHDQAQLAGHVLMPTPPSEDGGPPGAPVPMSIVEIHQAQIVSARGELPWVIDPNESVAYADLSGAGGAFGTIDYGDGSAAPTGYLGREVRLSELGLDPTSVERPPDKPTAKAARMECPACHGALELRAPDVAMRVSCPYCRELVDVTREPLRALGTLGPLKPQLEPVFALGTQVTLRGTAYTVLGHLRRDIEGKDFSWDEYILWGGAEVGYRYLVVSDGHFTLVQPISYGDLRFPGSDSASYNGRTYRLVEGCTTRVSHVNGEFPWAVTADERAGVRDFACPEHGGLLSIEQGLDDRAELLASVGEYLDAKEVWGAFVMKPSLPKPRWIAPHQPNPFAARLTRQKRLFLWTAAVLVAIMMLASMTSHPAKQSFDLTTVAGVEPAAEHIFVSEPFQLGQSGTRSLEFALSAPVQNSWIGADVALINEETGESSDFGAEVAYYSGVDDGESWSEGSRRATVSVPSIAAGRYVLRVEPAWAVQTSCTSSADCGFIGQCEDGKCMRTCTAPAEGAADDPLAQALGRVGLGCPAGQVCAAGKCALAAIPYKIALTWGASQGQWAFIFIFGVLIWPLLWTWYRRYRFEQRRKEDQD